MRLAGNPQILVLLSIASCRLVIVRDCAENFILFVVISAVNTVRHTRTVKLVARIMIRPKIVCGLWR